MQKLNGYWFFLEPYVYFKLGQDQVLLYNTLDSSIIESEDLGIISLLHDVLKKGNGGVSFLSNEQYANPIINRFVHELRKKYMGDIINTNLSQSKPVQIIPYVNFPERRNLKGGFLKVDNVLQLLSEVTVQVNSEIKIEGMFSFLKLLPENVHLNFKIEDGFIDIFKGIQLDRFKTSISLILDYNDPSIFESLGLFPATIHINFPVDTSLLYAVFQFLDAKKINCDFEFFVRNYEEFKYSNQIVDQYELSKYKFRPIYTKDNINFFKEYIFLSREDILSSPISMKDIFKRQVLNTNDFGKLNILANGDVYANKYDPMLGNIYTDNIYDLVRKEINEGASWLRTRSSKPCSQCLYQWLCPSPSDYELEIDKCNLCNIQ